MLSILCMNAHHTLLWMVDPDGLIVQSEPNEDYTGCWVPEAASLKPGDLATYQTPDRKRTVQLLLPVRSVHTS